MKLLLTLSAFATVAAASAQFITYGSYSQASDSPLYSLSGFQFEDFEDGQVNTPGISLSGGGILAGSGPGLVDSVDGDDGTVDGGNSFGRSWYSAGNNFITVSFAPGAKSAGVVLTDVGFTDNLFCIGDYTVSGYDGLGNLISTYTDTFGDGAANGASAEDIFLGYSSALDVSKIVIGFNGSSDWELDHVQYATQAVPEPMSMLALAAGAAALLRRRRK